LAFNPLFFLNFAAEMAENNLKNSEKSIQTGKISILISLSLVLFMVGLLALVLINTRKVSNHVKENINLNVFISDSASQAEIAALQKQLDATEYVKGTHFVTKEQAATEFKEELGEDFVSFLGYNPLRSSIDVKVNAAYANADSLQKIEKRMLANPIVREVFYQKSLVNLVNDNVRKIGLFLMIFSILLSIISIALINHSIRLYIYSKRFLIRTMQLVGATHGFIRKPFLSRAVFDGVMASVITWLMLAGVILLLEKNIPELIELRDVDTFAVLFAVVPVLGMMITVGSTYFAMSKYLKLQTEELYK
jgi:cell division transport system permease protein